MLTMAEPKKKKGSAAGRRPGARPPRKIIVAFKGYQEFDDWLRELAARQRLPVSVLIEHALVDYAEKHKFGKGAPER